MMRLLLLCSLALCTHLAHVSAFVHQTCGVVQRCRNLRSSTAADSSLPRRRSALCSSAGADSSLPSDSAIASEAVASETEASSPAELAPAAEETKAPPMVAPDRPATLDSSTPWRVYLSLRDPDGPENSPTTNINVVVRFIEDANFEPPQGRIEVLEENPYVPIDQGKFARWTLSEGMLDKILALLDLLNSSILHVITAACALVSTVLSSKPTLTLLLCLYTLTVPQTQTIVKMDYGFGGCSKSRCTLFCYFS
jgi:hypothetical protein